MEWVARCALSRVESGAECCLVVLCLFCSCQLYGVRVKVDCDRQPLYNIKAAALDGSTQQVYPSYTVFSAVPSLPELDVAGVYACEPTVAHGFCRGVPQHC